MKNKFSSLIALALCFVLVVTIFTACTKREKVNDSTTTTGVTWAPGEGSYQPVEIGSGELAEIVKDALGEEYKFDGNLDSLPEKDYQKVINFAEKEGYIVEDKDEPEDVVIKKDQNNLTTTQITTVIGSTKESKKTKEDKTDKTDKNDKTKATESSKKEDNKTTKKDDKKVSVVDNTVAPTKETTRAIVTNAPYSFTTETGTKIIETTDIKAVAANTFGNGSSCNFTGSATTTDGGVVAIGTVMSDASNKSTGYSSALIVKFTADGQKSWSKIISGNNATSFEDVAVLTDGSIIAVGYTLASDLADNSAYKCKDTVEAVVSKFDASGNLRWTKMFGGSKGDIAYAVAATPDGGFMIGGKSESSDGDLKNTGDGKLKAYVAKYGKDGKIAWVKALSGSKHCAVFDIATTGDGSAYIVIETVNNDGDFAKIEGSDNKRYHAVVARINSEGGWNWAKGISETGRMVIHNVVVGNDGGCVVAGYYSVSDAGTQLSLAGQHNGGETGTYDGIIIKFNSKGDKLWHQALIGFENDMITGLTAIDGGYAVTGYTTSTNRDFPWENKGNYDSFIWTVSNGGRKMQARSFGGSGSDRAMCACRSGKNVYLLGNTNSGDGTFVNGDAKVSGTHNNGFIYNVKLEQNG
ncbi:MAG: hypothetical protein MJ125_06325 [Clostridia bacterium]|nr:hypothetical protein [Clostridia bacterium]